MLKEPHNFFAFIILTGAFVLLGISLFESVEQQRALEVFIGPVIGFVLAYYFNVTGFKAVVDKIIKDQIDEYRREMKSERS